MHSNKTDWVLSIRIGFLISQNRVAATTLQVFLSKFLRNRFLGITYLKPISFLYFSLCRSQKPGSDRDKTQLQNDEKQKYNIKQNAQKINDKLRIIKS